MKSEFDCHAVDLPGYGEEAPIHYFTLFNVATHLYETYLKGEKWILVCHSMGGYVGLTVAEYYGEVVEGIILVHSHPLSDDPERRLGRKASLSRVDENMQSFIEESLRRVSDLPPDKLKRYVECFSPEIIKQSIMAMAERPDRTHLLARFPVAIVHGIKDTFLPFERVLALKDRYPSLKIHKIEGCHMSMIENTRELIEIIKGFVGELK